jgi:hypothetical protein
MSMEIFAWIVKTLETPFYDIILLDQLRGLKILGLKGFV